MIGKGEGGEGGGGGGGEGGDILYSDLRGCRDGFHHSRPHPFLPCHLLGMRSPGLPPGDDSTHLLSRSSLSPERLLAPSACFPAACIPATPVTRLLPPICCNLAKLSILRTCFSHGYHKLQTRQLQGNNIPRPHSRRSDLMHVNFFPAQQQCEHE